MDKLDKSVFIPLIKRIRKLSENPLKQGKPIGDGYRELRYEKFRVYYDVMHDAILVERITYEGKVSVARVGDKKSQWKDIAEVRSKRSRLPNPPSPLP